MIRVSIKKLLATTALPIMLGIIICLTGCSNKADIGKIKDDYCKSSMYSTSDTKSAVKTIIDKFIVFDGCDLPEEVELRLLIKFIKAQIFS